MNFSDVLGSSIYPSPFVCVLCIHFSFSAFKLFSNLTDLIGAVRLICTFRSLCDESNFVLSAAAAAAVAVVFATMFRKYLLSPRCIADSLTIFAAIGCCHSPLIRPPTPPPPPSSPFLIAESEWFTNRERNACCAAATRPKFIDVELVVVAVVVVLMVVEVVVAVCIHLLANLCGFVSNKIFLPITELDSGRFGSDDDAIDVADDDNVFDV